MRRVTVGGVWLVGLACAVAVARGELRESALPADATWVLRVDVKALRAAPMGATVLRALEANATRELSAFRTRSGIDLTNDVDELVLCGRGNAPTSGVLFASGRFDVARATALAAQDPQLQKRALGRRSLLSWTERGRSAHLCFVDPTLAVLSEDEGRVRSAVAEAASRGVAHKGEGPFARALARRPGGFLVFQANELGALTAAAPQLQVLRQAEAVLLETGQQAGSSGLACTLTVTTASPEMAQQVHQTALGLQALLMLQAGQNPEMAALAQGVNVSLRGACVTVGLTLPEEVLRKQLLAFSEQRAAAQAARRAARSAVHPAASGAGARTKTSF